MISSLAIEKQTSASLGCSYIVLIVLGFMCQNAGAECVLSIKKLLQKFRIDLPN